MADHIATTNPTVTLADGTVLPAVAVSAVRKYAPALLSLAVLILVGYEALAKAGYGLADVLVFVGLVASTIGVYFVPLVNARYRGWWKILVESVGIIAAAVIPFVIDGRIDRSQWVLIVVAVLKAVATHWGVEIRTDQELDRAEAVKSAAAGTGGALVYSGVEVEQIHDGSDLAPDDAPAGPNG